MGYELLDEGTFADVAVRCRAETLEELFGDNAEALVAILVSNSEEIHGNLEKELHINAEDIELLLYDFINELVYQKDVNNLLLVPGKIQVHNKDSSFHLDAVMKGERMGKKCSFNVDVKAATMHELAVTKKESSWESFIILDV